MSNLAKVNKKKLERAKELYEGFCTHVMRSREMRDALGQNAAEMEQEKLYTLLGFTSFEGMIKHIENEFGVKRSTIFDAKKIYLGLKHIDKAHRILLPRENAMTLLLLPEKQRSQKSVLEHAIKLPGREFKKYLNTEKRQHLEAPRVVKFTDVPEGGVAEIDSAIFMARLEGEWPKAGSVHPLEVIATNYNDQLCQVEEFLLPNGEGIVLDGMTNREAFEAISEEIENGK